MEEYEAPTLTEVGSVADLTQGDLFHPGQDHRPHTRGHCSGDKPFGS